MRKEKLNELNSYIEEYKSIKISPVKKRILSIFNPDRKTFLSSIACECKLNNGKIIIREKLLKGKGDGSAAIIFPLTIDHNVILVVEPRVFTKETVGVGFPAGYIEAGEDPIIGAERELREECGYVPREMVHLDSYYQDEGCSSAYNSIYLALDCEKKFNQNLDRDEYIRYFECTFDEAIELEQMGYIKTASGKLALERVKTYLKRR
jgi:ADP-ribose pyrophosphatase